MTKPRKGKAREWKAWALVVKIGGRLVMVSEEKSNLSPTLAWERCCRVRVCEVLTKPRGKR